MSEPTAKSTALLGVEIWNPANYGIQGAPLMVPAKEFNRIVSNLQGQAIIASRHVPVYHSDYSRIKNLDRELQNDK